MSNNNLITIDSLDFDGIKTNIKNFLRGQLVFTDYNFEGSALSTLIDVLAYNTHYNALYANMTLNESFIDSASKYSSVVSLAKLIGYTAKLVKSAKTLIKVTMSGLPDPLSPVLTIPKNTIFSSKSGSEEFKFLTRQAYLAELVGDSYVFDDIEVYEGTLVKNEFITQTNSNFVIPSNNIDLSSLNVRVFNTVNSSVYDTYKPVNDLLALTGVDKVYFIKQREDLFYEIYFGNNTLGKAIEPGNVVSIDYAISRGDAANNCKTFYYSSGFLSEASYRVETKTIATGGAPAETIELIKFNAPRMYMTQNRAVTADDYRIQLTGNFPQLELVTVWGGQDNSPPQFGKVFILAKPYGRDSLTELERSDIKNFLKLKRAVMTVQHEFVQPKVLDILINCTAYYNEQETNKSSGDISALVRGLIITYSSTLNKFNTAFRYSKLSRIVDTADKSIVSNITNILIRYKESPYFGNAQTYNLDIRNPIKQRVGSFTSDKFNSDLASDPCYIIDDGILKLNIYLINSSNESKFIRTVGLISYSTGTVVISALNIVSLYDTTEFYFYIKPSSNDIIPVNQYVLQIAELELTVSSIADSILSGFLKSGLNHTFAPST